MKLAPITLALLLATACGTKAPEVADTAAPATTAVATTAIHTAVSAVATATTATTPTVEVDESADKKIRKARDKFFDKYEEVYAELAKTFPDESTKEEALQKTIAGACALKSTNGAPPENEIGMMAMFIGAHLVKAGHDVVGFVADIAALNRVVIDTGICG